MYDMFDYLQWRGDLPFNKVEPNPVDLLIFSTLAYINFDGIVSETEDDKITLKEAAERFLALPNREMLVRVKKDIELLEAAAGTVRFGEVKMAFYRNIFEPEKETQFAAVTYYPGDGTAVLTFRGTDRTLVGWKEDFNMFFQSGVPAQAEALRYLNEFAIHTLVPIRLSGHSKGGNLAVYAAAKSEVPIQKRILEIHNQDGPGFSNHMISDPGYRRIIPKILKYVPESSVVGMLLEYEEPYTVIRSKRIGPMQHDPYSWEVIGNGFIYKEGISENSKKVDRTIRAWLDGMTIEERNTLADVIYDVVTSGGAVTVEDMFHPKQIRSALKTLASDENKRRTIIGRTKDLIQAIVETQEVK